MNQTTSDSAGSLEGVFYRFTQLLTTLHYSKDTVRHYSYIWQTLLKYGLETNQCAFAFEWVSPFIIKHYCIPLEGKLTRTHKSILRGAEMLLSYQQTGYIIKRTKVSKQTVPEKYLCLKKAIDLYGAERKLEPRTIRTFNVNINRFVCYLSSHNINLDKMTPLDVQGYFISMTPLETPTKAFASYVLKKTLEVLYKQGITKSNLSLSCPMIKVPNDRRIPTTYTKEEIASILNTVDRESPSGKRDFAILLLAIELGMRVGDIRDLCLMNFNWEKSQLHFSQSKTRNEVVLPIPSDVGWAVIDYLKNGRPNTTSKNIFVRHIVPFDPFGPNDNLYNIVSKYFTMAHVKQIPGKKRGMHAFRHSLASNMIAEGVSLPVVSETLGHAETNSTMRYVKVAVDQLRSCALEVLE
jgi:site-specific recombinase XerD